MLSILDRDKLCVNRVDEKLDLLLRVGDRVDYIICSLAIWSVLYDFFAPMKPRTCNHITGHLTSKRRPCNPSLSLRLMAAILALRLPSSVKIS